jgi:hypothetical protein
LEPLKLRGTLTFRKSPGTETGGEFETKPNSTRH